MSGNGDIPDLCDCGAFNQFRSIQRLLDMIRQNQQACNERECLISDINQNAIEGHSDFQLMLIFLAWILLVSLMYLFWPRSNLRKLVNSNNDHDNNDNSEASSN